MGEKNSGFRNSGFALVSISHALNHSYDRLLPILYPSMISELHLSYSLVGMLVMGYRLSSGSLQLLMGFLGRFVRRKILLGIAMIWQSVTNALIAVSPRFEHILINRTLAGVGASPQHPTGASYIAETFPKKQLGRAFSINLLIANIGMFVAPMVGSLLLESLTWRAIILVFSIPGIIVGVAFFFIREPKRVDKWSGFSSFSYLLKGIHDVLSNRIVLAVLILETVMAFRYGAADFIPTYLVHDLNITSLEAGLMFTVFTFFAIPAPYVWGHLSDRFERRKIVVLASSIASIMWFILPYVRGNIQVLLILISIGFSTWGIGGIVQAFVAESTRKENRDLIYGIYFTLSYIIGSFSPLIIGHIADLYGFQASFTWIAAILSLSVIAAAYLLRRVASD